MTVFCKEWTRPKWKWSRMEKAQKYTGMNINSGFDSLFFGERYISRNILTNVFQNMRPVVQGSKDA